MINEVGDHRSDGGDVRAWRGWSRGWWHTSLEDTTSLAKRGKHSEIWQRLERVVATSKAEKAPSPGGHCDTAKGLRSAVDLRVRSQKVEVAREWVSCTITTSECVARAPVLTKTSALTQGLPLLKLSRLPSLPNTHDAQTKPSATKLTLRICASRRSEGLERHLLAYLCRDNFS